MFPQLADYLTTDGPATGTLTLEPEMRPIAAILGKKGASLWLRERVFLESTGAAETGKHFTEHTSQNVPAERRHTVTSLLAQIRAVSADTSTRGVQEKERLQSILDAVRGTRTRVDVDWTKDAKAGFYVSEHLRSIPEYTTPFVSDHIHDNNSSRRYTSSYKPPKSAREGCEKSFPVNEKFSSGIMIMTCGCGNRVIYAVCFMDSAESVSMPFDIMMQRFAVAPKYVFYDNACHLHYYCVSREPAFFWKTTFVVDRFHEHNHTACSKSYMCSFHTHDEKLLATNTQAVEQVNSSFRKSMELNLRFMNMGNAILYLAVYIALYNTKKDRKERLDKLFATSREASL